MSSLCFTESTVSFVDTCLARAAFHHRPWADQVNREFTQRHQERAGLAAAKKILGLSEDEGGTPCQM